MLMKFSVGVFNKIASIREKGTKGNSKCLDYRKNSSKIKVFPQIQKTHGTAEDLQHLKSKIQSKIIKLTKKYCINSQIHF